MVDLLELARRKSAQEVREVADAVRAGEVSRERVNELTRLVEQADDDAQVQSLNENAGIADLFNALDVPPPMGFGTDIGEVEVEDEDVEVVPDDEPDEPVDEGLVDEDGVGRIPPQDQTGGRGGTAVGPGRLSNLAVRFPQPQVRSEYQRLENARQNLEESQQDDVDPGPFYDEFQARILGQNPILTRNEFIEGEQSPDTTGMFG